MGKCYIASKPNIDIMSGERLAEKSLSILKEKSEKAISSFKQTVLEEKTGIKKVNTVLEQYISRWTDTTRPGTLALSCEAAGGKPDEAVPLQVALLFIDATMDIHDDIIDESSAKKNVKTIYGRLGKEAALLIGDAFMVRGFSHLQEAVEKLPREQQALIIAGVREFLLEVVDAHISEAPLKAKDWSVKPETYLQVLTKKAADIEGRMKVGAIYGGGSQKEVEALSKYGRKLGLLLAIRAEFVDMFETDELANRMKKEVLPLPVLYAIQNRTQREKIRGILSTEKITKDDCANIVNLVQNSKDAIELRSYLEILEKEAADSLAALKKSKAKSSLQFIAASMLEDL